MLIVYASRFGNTKKFVNRLGVRSLNINDINIISEPYILVTFTFGFGEIPEEVQSFLENGDNAKYLRAVASGGNRIWGDNFGKAADTISERYNVPIILKFELQGEQGDTERFKESAIQHGFKMDRIE